jgi:hypothetical protein
MSCLGTNSSVTYWQLVETMVFYLRDLHFSGEDIKPLARFTPHKTPITSVEWHPTIHVGCDRRSRRLHLRSSVEEDDTGSDGRSTPAIVCSLRKREQFKEVHWHPTSAVLFDDDLIGLLGLYSIQLVEP